MRLIRALVRNVVDSERQLDIVRECVGDTRIGWTAGLGIEYMMWSNWSVKLEYLYADLGREKHDGGAELTSNVPGAGELVDAFLQGDASSLEGEGDFEVDLHTLRLGINLHF